MLIPAKKCLIRPSRVFLISTVQKRLVLLASLRLSAVVSAGEIQQASVEHKDGIYILELDVVVASQFAPVHAIVTDDENLEEISGILIKTSLLSDADAKIKRRRSVLRTCILFFCFTAKMVEDVWGKGNSIITEIVTELSDYKFSETEWQVIPMDEGHTAALNFTVNSNRLSGSRR